MNPTLKKLGSTWQAWVALVVVVSGGASAFRSLWEKLSGTVTILQGLPLGARWIVVAALVLVALLLLSAALSRRSELLQPQRFRLSPEDPQHLVGREEEIRHLARQCHRHALVFLVGDSGSGKTSLVRAGLAHALRTGADLVKGVDDVVPLVVDLSGLRWDSGLAIAIARELHRLSAPTLQDLGAKAAPPAQDVFTWLRHRPAEAPSRPLIILDQFDDYLAVHRERFYDGTTLRRPAEIEANSDWQGIADLLRRDAIHLLLVARPEVADSLQALRFVEEGRIVSERLFSLEATLALPLLDRLAEPVDGHPVVSEPEFGWLQLRSRLLRDLKRSGGGLVRPIQLAVALNCLWFLRHLTVAEYERAGGLLGLERLHIERHANRAAQVADIPVKDILEALRTLVSPDATKAHQIESTTFDRVLVDHGARPAVAASAVRQLENDMILRRVSENAGGPGTLLLYHDHLAHGIREAHRQANRWNELLREKWQGFTEALGWRQRWRALLSPTEQARLVWESLRGRFTFGDKRRFFGLSLLRWLPVVLTLVLLGLAGWGGDEYRKREIASEVMAAIGHTGEVTQEEAGQIHRLAGAGHRALVQAFRLIAESPSTAARASQRVDYLVGMATGLDPNGQRSRALIRDFVLPALASSNANARSVACRAVASGRLRVLGSEAGELAQAIVRRMEKEADPVALWYLSEALGRLSAELERDDILPGAQVLLDRMKVVKNNSHDLRYLGGALGVLGAKLEREDILPGAQVLLDAMRTEKYNSSDIEDLSKALGVLSAKLDREDILPGAQVLMDAMRTGKYGTLVPLSKALGALSAKLGRDDILPGVQVLLDRMKTEKDYYFNLPDLSKAIGLLSAKLEREDILPGAQVLMDAMKTEKNDSAALQYLGAALGRLSAKLDREDILPVAQVLMDRMKVERNNSHDLRYLGAALGALSAKLEREDILPGAQVLMDAMRTEMRTERKDSDVLESFSIAQSFGALSTKLDSKDVLPGAKVLLDRINVEENGDDPRPSRGWDFRAIAASAQLSAAIVAFSAGLDSKDALGIARILLKRMKAEKDNIHARVFHCGTALAALGARLDNEDALVVEQLVLSHIGTELNPEKLDLLVKTFARRDAAARRAVSFPPYRRPVPIEQVYVDLLKNPLIVGETRATLLAVLEEATGQAFQGDQWRFVDWATQTEAGRAMQLDLESPPPWELADHRPRSLSATTDDAQESRPEVSRCSGGD